MAGSVEKEGNHAAGEPDATAPGTSSRNGMSTFLQGRPRARRVLLVAGVVVAVAGVWVWWYYAGRESTDDAQIDGHIVPIAPRVGGTVLAVKVEDNQVVAAGTVLVEIDPKDYRVALQRAEADYQDAQAALEAAKVGIPITSTTTAGQVSAASANVGRAEAGGLAAARDVEAARARRTAADARLREATANATKLTRDLERMKQLIAKDEVSQQQYDAAVAGAEAARAAVESAQASLAEAAQAVSIAESRRVQAERVLNGTEADLRIAHTGPEQVTVAKARAESAEARVKQAQALLEQAELNLQYTTITAPAAGRVSKKSVEPGQVVEPGQPLLAIVPLEDIWVTANFKETQLKDMRPGQAVSVSVDAYDRTYRGRVDSIAGATGARFSLLPPENATGNYVKVVQRVPVKIVLDRGQDTEHLLRPGMSVVPTVYTR
jgi:membrane fusion protein (multidrug efflux system)